MSRLILVANRLPVSLDLSDGQVNVQDINERFADAVCAQASEEDLIWIHVYHLLLLPKMLRERLPRARIGFFLHIPFPSSEIFRLLPHREQLLYAMLGANLIGFHTRAQSDQDAPPRRRQRLRGPRFPRTIPARISDRRRWRRSHRRRAVRRPARRFPHLCAGTLATRARYRVTGPEQIRLFLRSFIDARKGQAA